MLYPQVSRIYYRVDSSQQVATFDAEKAKLTSDEVKRRIELAKAFNSSLINNNLEDPYSEDQKIKAERNMLECLRYMSK